MCRSGDVVDHRCLGLVQGAAALVDFLRRRIEFGDVALRRLAHGQCRAVPGDAHRGYHAVAIKNGHGDRIGLQLEVVVAYRVTSGAGFRDDAPDGIAVPGNVRVFIVSPMWFAIWLAMMSVPPPGGHGTIRRTGREGHCWAVATPASPRKTARRRNVIRLRDMIAHHKVSIFYTNRAWACTLASDFQSFI